MYLTDHNALKCNILAAIKQHFGNNQQHSETSREGGARSFLPCALTIKLLSEPPTNICIIDDETVGSAVVFRLRAEFGVEKEHREFISVKKDHFSTFYPFAEIVQL